MESKWRVVRRGRERYIGEQKECYGKTSRGTQRWVPKQRKSFSLFVDNIQRDIKGVELKDVFQSYGRVVDVYISKKQRPKGKFYFGFIRYELEQEAWEAIRRTNRMMLRGLKLHVKMARFGKEISAKQKSKPRSFIEAAKTGLRTIKGRVCSENLLWLRKSIVVDLKCPSTSDQVRKVLKVVWPTASLVRDMGNFKKIFTFNSVEEMEAALSTKQDGMEDYISKVKKWSVEDVCQKRSVWVEIYGLPPHAWSKENMMKIVKPFGDLVTLDKATELGSSMDVARVLIHTTYMPFLEENLILLVENDRFEIFMKEIDRQILESDAGSSNLPVESSPLASRVAESASQKPPKDFVEGLGDALNDNFDCGGSGRSQVHLYERMKGIYPLNSIDDIAHLPMRNNEKGTDLNDALNGRNLFDLDAEDSNKTDLANVNYNLEEEFDLIASLKNNRRREFLMEISHIDLDPGSQDVMPLPSTTPGFVIDRPLPFSSPTSCQANGGEDNICMDGPSSIRRKRGRPRKIVTKVPKKLSKKGTLEAQDGESSDDYQSNEEEEARKTWELGKQLGLVATNDEFAVQEILQLRRSTRKQGHAR